MPVPVPVPVRMPATAPAPVSPGTTVSGTVPTARTVPVARVMSATARVVTADGGVPGYAAIVVLGTRSRAGLVRRKRGMLRCGHRPIIARTWEALCSPRPN
ncbi:hypothetical protein GCM10022384_38930 [Streptomyces marokkonensis]|uniref:BRCT domain-containing protein n=1 Tax=Streptomyces marokkonensis TaxID=324855 RepID=A0ABP7QS47_9ACTN